MPGESEDARLARLEERSEAILRELQRIGKEVQTFAPIGGQLIELIAETTSLRDDFEELRQDIKDAAKERGLSRTQIVVAAIAGSCLLLSSLIAAVAAIVGGH